MHRAGGKVGDASPFGWARFGVAEIHAGWKTSVTCALAVTVRYECAQCGHHLKDTPVNRRWIENHGRFVALNPNAARSNVSYTWNALLPHWVEWRLVVEEFITALSSMRTTGDIEPMITFVTETLGEPWESDRWMSTGDDHIVERKGDYDFDDPWPLEGIRFLAADRQAKGGEHYFWVCRALGAGGASRLLGYGRCNTVEELEEVRKRLRVEPVNSLIDSGFKASEVYLFCLSAGWRPMKGDDAEWFLRTNKRTGRTVRKLWRLLWVDPNFGMAGSRGRGTLAMYQWSNPTVKDHLALFTRGAVGQWTVPRTTGRDYFDQLTAEVREEREDARGRTKVIWVQKRRDNHYLDCELMIHTAAVITGFVRVGSAEQGEAGDIEKNVL